MIHNTETTDYLLGVVMGTNSIGMAMVTPDYELLRIKGGDAWNVRKFDSAELAQNRRTHRAGRRRIARARYRIELLKRFFRDAVEKEDANFFTRLEDSRFREEDKSEEVRSKNSLFDDPNYTDKDFFADFPTPFHLRRELIENAGAHDVRLVFLAALNIFKHRGHFHANVGEAGLRVADAYAEFTEELNALLDEGSHALEIQFGPSADTDQIEGILADRKISKTEKHRRLKSFFGVTAKETRKAELLKLLCGMETKLNIVFALDTDEKVPVNFSKEDAEEAVLNAAPLLEESQLNVVLAAREVYSAGMLSKILNGHAYLSEASIESFEKHRNDLKLLKEVVREFGTKEDYDRMFRGDVKASYSAYINRSNSSKGKFRRGMNGRTRDEFYKNVKSILKNFPEDPRIEVIKKDIEAETFLPKQRSSDNAVIPNQVHYTELKRILNNAEEYLPFLKERDERGLTVKEKILMLFSFRIPYYVGPVSEKSEEYGGNGWVVRKEGGEVLPWTIEEKIDLPKTSERFIQRMVRDCSYIPGRKVLPRHSLIYERYTVLNEINNLRIDGEKISREQKQEIFNNLFEEGSKISRSRLCRYLKQHGYITDDVQITGIDKQINSCLGSLKKFRAILGHKIEEERYRELAETVIYWASVFGDDKNMIREKLEKHYGDILAEAEINAVAKLKFRDWGKLSYEFLTMEGIRRESGEIVTIMDALWDDPENLNLMELLHSSKYTFREELEKRQTKRDMTLDDITYEDLDGAYLTAPVKRMVWQAILNVREAVHVTGAYPKKVFVEMARSDEEKGDAGRKASRRKELETIYKKMTGVSADWKKKMLFRIAEADESGLLRSKKVFLYFLQMGKCMYTAEPIPFKDLLNNDLYDVDHIYPKHYIKDDSIHNNRVLVRKQKNADKKDAYPVKDSIRHDPAVRDLWVQLKKNRLITDEKYNRLVCAKPFTDEQLAGFISRQLVETRQGTKALTSILRQVLPEDTRIVCIKAGLISDFRRDFGMLKSRALNINHRAQDAYLSVVVGNAYDVKFTANPINFIKNEFRQKKAEYHMNHVFDRDIRRGEETAWIASHGSSPGTIAKVREVMAKNTPKLTRMSLVSRGSIAKQNLIPAKAAKPGVHLPVKTSDPRLSDVKKHGGYNSVSTAYFVLAEHNMKGDMIRTIEPIPTYALGEVENDRDALLSFLTDTVGLVDAKVVIPKIQIQSKIIRNGYELYLTGKTSGRLSIQNAVRLCLRQEWANYVHDIEKSIDGGYMKASLDRQKNMQLYDILTDKHTNTIFAKKPNSIGGTLINGRDAFEALSEEKQIKTLREILRITEIGPGKGNLKDIDGKKNSGSMTLNKEITEDDNRIILVHQSVTGFYEKRIDLFSCDPV